MIEAFTGLMGSGKTYLMTLKALKLKRQGFDVYANYFLAFADGFIEESNDLERFSNFKVRQRILICLDEAQMWFFSRNWKTNDIEKLKIFAQGRKLGLRFFYSAQHIAGVDAYLRRITMIEHNLRRFGPFVIDSMRDGASGEFLQKQIFILNPSIFRLYDTTEVISADGDHASLQSWLVREEDEFGFVRYRFTDRPFFYRDVEGMSVVSLDGYRPRRPRSLRIAGRAGGGGSPPPFWGGAEAVRGGAEI